MYSLRLLGGLVLEDPSGPVSGPATQPVRLALLAVLAVPEVRPVSRDKLVGLLWPDRSPQRARRHLSDTLYVLRRELGEDIVRSPGDALRLDDGRVRTDVAAYRQALERGAPEEAVRTYGGPFLDGVHLRDSVEFERWTDGHRQQLARKYQEALASLARSAEATGDLEAAVEWRRKLVAERPYSTSAAIALMRALEKTGDPAAAVRAGHLHEERLKDELDAEPDPTLREELERIRTSPRAGQLEPSDSAPAGASRGPFPAAGPSADPGPTASSDERSGSQPGPVPVPTRPAFLAALALLGALGAWAVVFEAGGPPAPKPDSGRVAVFPFRVGGASPSLEYLREGMVDLLGTKLTGEVGPQAVDPRSSLSAWKRHAAPDGDVDPGAIRDAAAGLGAGLALTGEVVGSPDQLAIAASLEPVDPDGTRIAARVVGTADSLTVLVDRLVARLLVEIAGRPGRSLESLTTPSLPALRAYLAGREAYRAGHERRAVESYNTALDHDSAFALAAIGLAEASFGLPGGSAGRHPYAERGLRLARSARARLSADDRRYLDALSRPRYPARMFPWAEVIAEWESVDDELLAKPEAWFQLGRHLAEFGPQTGRADVHELAASALSRTLRLDSTYLPALERLVWVEARQGDREALERLDSLYREQVPSGGGSDYVRWRLALELEDEGALADLRSRFDELDNRSLVRIVGFGQVDGVGLRDVHTAAEILRRRVRDRRSWDGAYSRGVAAYLLKNRALNGGRPEVADSLLRVRWEGRLTWPRYHRDRVMAALYERGDTAGIAESVRRLTDSGDSTARPGSKPTEPVDPNRFHPLDSCIAWQWRLWRGDTVGAAPAIRRIRRAEPVRDTPCTTVLELLLAAERGGDAARRARSVAEEYVADAWHWPAGFMLNFAAARLYERLGDYDAAADALRHRPYRAVSGSWTLGYSLHETGRLSLLGGDTAQALSAYRHWLALHADPEESRRNEVERVRRLVASLETRNEAR